MKVIDARKEIGRVGRLLRVGDEVRVTDASPVAYYWIVAITADGMAFIRKFGSFNTVKMWIDLHRLERVTKEEWAAYAGNAPNRRVIG